MLSAGASILVGVVVRACLFAAPDLVRWLETRPEVSTPQSSWIRLKEGIALYEHNISLYDGDSYHDTPLMLHLFNNIKQISPLLFPVLFMLADAMAAWHLYLFAKIYVQEQVSSYQENKGAYAKDVLNILPDKNRLVWVPDLVCMLYMLNPYIMATCIGKSTVVFNNLFLCLIFYHSIKGNAVQMTLFLALSSYQTLYPMQLLAPVILCYRQTSASTTWKSALKITFLFVCWFLLLFGPPFLSSSDSYFATYKFILTVPDLMPNVGIFWYFFTEVFDHFRTFFLSVFQLTVLIFSIPLTIKLRSRPIFLMFMLCYIIAIFKSYPCVADAGFCLCLLPLWSYTFNYLRFPLVTSVMLVVCTVLCPIMWHLWIQAVNANANFYFAVTLAYSMAHVLIMTDVMVSYLKFEFHLREGLKPKVAGTDKPALVRLKN